MSRLTVRRLTAAVVLLVVLCAAAPASAAPASRPASPAFGLSLLDPFFAWLGNLWPGHEGQRQVPEERTGTLRGSSGNGGSNEIPQAKSDGGGVTDPNG